MTPQELKNSILQQAIQGKLVEQCPEEGTAEELLAGISVGDSVDGRILQPMKMVLTGLKLVIRIKMGNI